MLSDLPDHPVAVLLGLDHSERVIAVPESPPQVYELAIAQTPRVNESEASSMADQPRRVFRLSRLRSTDHRWMRVYNDGRTQTPEDGYVYLEVAALARTKFARTKKPQAKGKG